MAENIELDFYNIGKDADAALATALKWGIDWDLEKCKNEIKEMGPPFPAQKPWKIYRITVSEVTDATG